MDIEKLIVSLRSPSWQDLEDPDATLLDDAATALSMIPVLQAEKEKLRAELDEKEKYYDQMIDALAATNSTELEQVKRERDAAVADLPHTCETCLYHKVFFNGCTPDHDCTNPDGGCSNNYDRWQWRGPEEG